MFGSLVAQPLVDVQARAFFLGPSLIFCIPHPTLLGGGYCGTSYHMTAYVHSCIGALLRIRH